MWDYVYPAMVFNFFAKPPASASVSRAWLQLAPLSAEQHHLVTRLRPEGVERNCEIHTQQIKDYWTYWTYRFGHRRFFSARNSWVFSDSATQPVCHGRSWSLPNAPLMARTKPSVADLLPTPSRHFQTLPDLSDENCDVLDVCMKAVQKMIFGDAHISKVSCITTISLEILYLAGT